MKNIKVHGDCFRLQFITHFTDKISYLDSVRIALDGGCRWVQLRMKGADMEEMYGTAVRAMEMCREAQAVFIIDDNVHLAKELGADGVHLGKNDMPISEARGILGEEFIIGGTANTFEDVLAHYRAGADYVGCGPFRFTTTKEKLSPILGMEGYAAITGQMRKSGIQIPIVAIGGITPDDIPGIMDSGADGIALSGTVLRAEEPVAMMRRIAGMMGVSR